MQRDLVVKGRTLGGSADLTLLAPIKAGFVDSLESVTYKTRIKRVLESLHGARMVSYEQHEARLLSDSIERVGVIQSVRVAVLEPEDKVLLAVTFDGSWQSYIRTLWDKVGTLLDLIFCGTEGYVTSYGHTFDEWLAWADRVQIETSFFYGPPDSTARDTLYHRRAERMRVRGAAAQAGVDAELLEMRTVLPDAEAMVSRTIDSGVPFTADDPQVLPIQPPRMIGQRIRIGLRGLAALYRLADLHRPFTPDGDVLHRAARDLLREFVSMYEKGLATDPFVIARGRFARQLAWLFPAVSTIKPRQLPPPAASGAAIPDEVLARIQGGIVRSYEQVTHGLVVLVAFENSGGACEFFEWAVKNVTRFDDGVIATPGKVFCNVAVSVSGLRNAGVGDDDIDLFPEEFRQGMAARAGLLGDVRNNHPQRWRRPRRFEGIDHVPQDGPDSFDVIDLDAVHAMIQFQTRASGPGLQTIDLHEPAHPLRRTLADFQAIHPDLRVLAVQSTRRRYADAPETTDIQEHFGYRDGLGQPELEPPLPGRPRNSLNRAHLGEVVHGHPNAADYPVDLTDTSLPEPIRRRATWLADGSFLVVRKYRQYVDRLEKTIAKAAATMNAPAANAEELAYAKLMGRWRDGTPLVAGNATNNFVYSTDPQGKDCPLHAHIRLAHPRAEASAEARASSRVPRLVRRGMSYGPAYVAGSGDARDRGLVFLAYNASISEQYEVVQRWLTGGNSTGSSSGQGCPFVGVPENGLARFHRFEYVRGDGASEAARVRLEGATSLFSEPEVLTRLEWGAYLFAPSFAVMARLRDEAAKLVRVRAVPVPWNVERGRKHLARLAALGRDDPDAARVTWKAAIEDPDAIDRHDAADLWAAIRHDAGGLLKTSYGTLVANRALVEEVLVDPGHRYSVHGQLARMNECFGEVYLGMDDGPRYREESTPVNAAIQQLAADPARCRRVYRMAFDAATAKLNAISGEAKQQGAAVGDLRFEVSVDVREVLDAVLAKIAEEWFGLDDPIGRSLFASGSQDWAWQPGEPPLYPGHFTALSRYIFQPAPGGTAREIARSYGQALRAAMETFVARHRRVGALPTAPDGSPAPIAKAIFEHPTLGGDASYVSKTLVGILMGLNPTIIGAVLNVVKELQRDDRFDALREALHGRENFDDAHALLDRPVREAAMMRPMPQLSWRTAVTDHRLTVPGLAPVPIAVGDVVVVATVSATQQGLEAGSDDWSPMFGGDRRAPAHPLHGCPGHGAAYQVIVATVAALLGRAETMRQGVGPLAFVLEGPTGFVRPPPPPVPGPTSGPVGASRKPGSGSGITAPPLPEPKRRGLVVAWGDSWLDYSFLGTELLTDLRDWLAAYGYRVPRDFCRWTTWTKISTMAADPGPFCNFLTQQIQNAVPGDPPLAVLLSGGGNDSTGNALFEILNPQGSKKLFDPVRLKAHIDGLRLDYDKVVAAVKSTLADEKSTIPILVHGYDHPFPDGKDGLSQWLLQPFNRRGYDYAKQGHRDQAADAMRQLIDEFDGMLASLALTNTTGSQVVHVSLPGTIAAAWGTADAAHGWANDLHPTDVGFAHLAKKIDDVLHPLSPTAPVVGPSAGAGVDANVAPRAVPATGRTMPKR